jgi:glycosyltransferase involved in cell wall biosynthesis
MVFQNVEDRDAFVQLGLAELDRTSVIRGSGVDPHVFTVAPEADGRPTVLYAGRLMRQKGLERFVELARTHGDRARFVVAGYPEPSSPDVVPVATVEAWAAEGVIEWLGARDDMPAVYAAASIVVLPTTYGEGVPKTLIEAASCGRAIVTTDLPGCRDVCRDGVNGLLVAPHDDEALHAAVLHLIEDRELRTRMGAAGRRLVEEEFSLEHVTSATLALYAELLAAR